MDEPVVELLQSRSWYSAYGKRGLDLLLGAPLALLSLPLTAILGAVSAVSLRAWPFFTQARVGRHGKTFAFPKIRTLSKQAPVGADKYEIAKVTIPPVCAFLRNTHLDELPQLWLVPLGRMSLVGPRPEMPQILERYPVAFATARSSVRPGCTGLWQVSTENARMIYEAPEFDEYYLGNSSLSLDLRILVLTVTTVIASRTRVSLDDLRTWRRRKADRSAGPTAEMTRE